MCTRIYRTSRDNAQSYAKATDDGRYSSTLEIRSVECISFRCAFTKSEFQLLRAAAAAAHGPETDSFRAFEANRKPKDNRPF